MASKHLGAAAMTNRNRLTLKKYTIAQEMQAMYKCRMGKAWNRNTDENVGGACRVSTVANFKLFHRAEYLTTEPKI